MSTAVQNPIPANPTPEHRQRGGKLDAETRISQLVKQVRDLEAQLEVARQESEALLDRLAAFEIADSARKQEEQANWNRFLSDCEVVRSNSPEFDAALRKIADIPPSWLREIVRMPNPAGFVLYLGAATQFLEYLREVKPEVAVKRLRQAGYDIHHKLPKFQGGN